MNEITYSHIRNADLLRMTCGVRRGGREMRAVAMSQFLDRENPNATCNERVSLLRKLNGERHK